MEPSVIPIFQRSPAWTQVLENIETSLTQVLAETARREQALPALAGKEAVGTDRWRQSLAVLEQRLRGLQALADRATAEVAEADALLVSCAQGLQRWQEAATAATRNLAEGPTGAVR